MSTATPPAAPTQGAAVQLGSGLGVTQRRVVRSEWTKLRSVRSTVWSLIATFGITVGLAAL